MQQSYRSLFNSLLLHFRPRTVPKRTLRLTLTWGLGGMAAVLVFLLFSTGLMLKFVYEPFPDRAYESILYLQGSVVFGQLIRNIHHWSGNGLVIVAFLHLLRVFFTGAFHPPRQFNWIIGLTIFFTILLSAFTGYLLPWDQLAFWAITICSTMLEYLPGAGNWLQELILGGPEVGPATLSNFYAIHTAALPALILSLLPFHFWRIRKAKGLVIPRLPEEDTKTRGPVVDTIPHLLVREIVVAMVLIACILVISMIFDAPLVDKANPGLSPNPTKAPWYFLGIQEMLMHFHPLFSLFIIPTLAALGLFALPYLRYQTNTAGIWFCSPTGRRFSLIAALTALVVTPTAILLDEILIGTGTHISGLPGGFSNGLLPFLLLLAGCAGFYLLLRKKFAASRNEAIQAVFVLLVTVFVILTMTGIWFRGEGMQLMWMG
jgi:quinol-cytochrome oxidoreductase complex cytochrome b subunit